MMSLLHTTDLAVGFPGQQLIANADLELNSGTMTALIGLNGTGKSTLLRTLSGLQKPLSGSIHVGGRSLDKLSAIERARSISMVLTERPHVGWLDVRTLVALGRHPWTGHLGKVSATDNERISDAMERTGAAKWSERGVHTLSDGELQKVLIARALAQEAPVMLLDEPTAFLDLVNRVSILRLLHGITRTHGRAVLFSTHDLQTAMELCDRLVLVKDGRLWSGTPAEAVASGVLAKAFSSDGLRFDPLIGALRSMDRE